MGVVSAMIKLPVQLAVVVIDTAIPSQEHQGAYIRIGVTL